MITFRYHAVTIVAVFLALTLGIFIGSGSISGTLVERLEGDLGRARSARDNAQDQLQATEAQLELLSRRYAEQIAPWAVDELLAGRNVVVVSGPEPTATSTHIRDALLRAQAASVGGIALNESLITAPSETLVNLVRRVFPDFTSDGDAIGDTVELLGATILQPSGRQLLAGLAEQGFVTITAPAGATTWPAPDSGFVAVTSPSPETAAEWVRRFATTTSGSSPTLVASAGVGDRTAVSLLREANVSAPKLSTFDSATDELDPGGVGTIAALVAAFQDRGGHFGLQDGRRFVPEP